MAETKKTFPRIEVRQDDPSRDVVTVNLIHKDGEYKSTVNSKTVPSVIFVRRSLKEAGDCCPVYDFRKDTA